MSGPDRAMDAMRQKSFDFAMADRSNRRSPDAGWQPQKGAVQTRNEVDIQRMRETLGFEEEFVGENTGQLEELQNQVKALQAALESAKTSEIRSAQKLQSFQQVNRSQSTLMKGELQKCRRMLVHAQAIANCFGERADWLQSQAPQLKLPVGLQGLPTEEDAAEEAAELLQMHRRWESDLGQLQAELQAESETLVASGNGDAELEAARKRIADLEAAVKKQHREGEKQSKELEHLRSQLAAHPGAPSFPASPADGAPQKELEAAQKDLKDQTKKLKQLATAYKQLDQKRVDLEAQLAESQQSVAALEAEAASPQVPVRQPLSAATVARVHELLAKERAQLAQLRAAVLDEFQRLPSMLSEAMHGQGDVIQRLVDAGAQEWKQKYNAECERRRKLHNLVQELKGNIRVYCRVRPLNPAFEVGSCISFPAPDEIRITNASMGSNKTWQFNQVYKEDSQQAEVFAGIRDLVVSMLDGYNVCIFAYGQTGAGKTHSMQGTPDNPGIYQRTFDELFKVAAERRNWTIELRGSIVEIYNEDIRDLLWVPRDAQDKRQKLQVRHSKEGGTHVPNLTTHTVSNADDVVGLLDLGQQNRSVAKTDMNSHSSRSHLLVQIQGHMATPDGKRLSSSITLVDLAGSERLAKSGVEGDRAKEAIAINKSLSALGDVINARATKSAHIPFRNSPLTQMLQDSLSGDSKTLMLLQINPCVEHVEESMCSLQFGARVNAVEMKK